MNHRTKKSIWFVVGVLSVLAIVGTGWAGPIVVNGNFESGNTGFTSDYEYTDVAGGLATGGNPSGGAEKYAVGTNPNYFHSSFTTAGDHTTGSGNMMIVNGSEVADVNVWTGEITGLVPGQTYEFSAWVMNVYPANPANLEFSYDGYALGTFSATGSGEWQQFTATFIATSSDSASAVELDLFYSGNDFALDDISVRAVPEPSLILLLGIGLGAACLAGSRIKR